MPSAAPAAGRKAQCYRNFADLDFNVVLNVRIANNAVTSRA
jgi:hypothetical protein